MVKGIPDPPYAYWSQIETTPNAGLGLAAASEIRTICLLALETVFGHPSSSKIDHPALDAWLLQNDRPYAQKEHAGRLFAQQFAHVTPNDPDPVILTALAETLPGRRRDVILDYVTSRWKLWIRRTKARFAPDHARYCLSALVALALEDTRFQLEVQQRFRRCLETRVLLYPDGENTIRPSAVTHLFLLVTFCKLQNLPEHITRTLSQLARKEAKRAGWAGFWDMWLLSQAASAGMPDKEWAWLPFPTSGDWIAAGGIDHDTENTWMMAPGWRQAIPAFAPSLLTNSF